MWTIGICFGASYSSREGRVLRPLICCLPWRWRDCWVWLYYLVNFREASALKKRAEEFA